jgi:hypothetical protein
MKARRIIFLLNNTKIETLAHKNKNEAKHK